MEKKESQKKKWLTSTTLVVGMTVVLGVIFFAMNTINLVGNMTKGIY